jgi:signal transduction histidine kinase
VHWRLAGVIAALAAIATSVAVGGIWPDDRVWPIGCLIAVAFTSVFLSAARTLLVGTVALLSSAIMMLLHPDYVGGDMMLPPLALQSLFVPLVVLATVHRDRFERESRSELEAGRHRLKEAQRIAGLGSWTANMESDEVLLSQECLALLNRDELPRPGLTGLLEVIDEEDREAFALALRELDKAGSGSISADLKMLNSEGKRRFVTSIVRTGAEPSCLEGTFQDVTDQVLARRAQEALESELAEARRMETIGRLAGGIAHDFNNFLTVILGNTSLLQQRNSDPLLEEISQVSDRAAKLVQQLLAFARRQVLAQRKLDLKVLVSELSPILEGLRKVDLKLAALAKRRFDLQGTATLTYDSLNRSQSEASAFAGPLGSEEGLKGVLQRVLVHARATVADGDSHVVTDL